MVDDIVAGSLVLAAKSASTPSECEVSLGIDGLAVAATDSLLSVKVACAPSIVVIAVVVVVVVVVVEVEVVVVVVVVVVAAPAPERNCRSCLGATRRAT